MVDGCGGRKRNAVALDGFVASVAGMRQIRFGLIASCGFLAACSTQPQIAAVAPPAPMPVYDVIIRGGTIYDGSGGAPTIGDVVVHGDRIVSVGGPAAKARGRTEVDARGLAVAPGFINMLSWANESLIADGRGQSDVRQGVTLEVMGEGTSMGPWNEEMKRLRLQRQQDIRYPITWTSLGEYLETMERKGVSPNIASFIGATTVRVHELGEKDVDPTPAQLERMRALVRAAMNEGAM